MSISPMRFTILSLIFSSEMPFSQQTATFVSERLPTLDISKRSIGVFRRFLKSAMFVLMSSINPSRGPFTAMSVGGSATARTAVFSPPR